MITDWRINVGVIIFESMHVIHEITTDPTSSPNRFQTLSSLLDDAHYDIWSLLPSIISNLSNIIYVASIRLMKLDASVP